MNIQESGEMYLETIYVLGKSGKPVRSIDICQEMGYSKPSVSRAVGLLKNGGFINVDGGGYITLTASGLEIAFRMYERHTLISELLIRLGVSEEVARVDACKIEHDISEESFAAIKAFTERRN
ncbi:MAG: metal-dependent transcriptional regulator [Clostridia bacterium]|nr:metal-dependent transcriptional regulator [Clostridia bacterium]